jgi:hypothetical protein
MKSTGVSFHLASTHSVGSKKKRVEKQLQNTYTLAGRREKREFNQINGEGNEKKNTFQGGVDR